ncbi:uncharacterized protein BDR25DRAFT_348512 [Lindgomyces ingoldianus]|uniref:Uncharacterized protein n=1 Tax=Lindgomyces ingoldianus TaxID=673940 RepID=A0ACB6RIU6_9PLEO|nr:uncharacterized protein BDR25DRAFT_348512 [Lindgomyces ingoldianus]KAF2478252.1 hypothetical protein BDR25DRAFT_348512 [Lindgomyces ingoldianus]
MDVVAVSEEGNAKFQLHEPRLFARPEYLIIRASPNLGIQMSPQERPATTRLDSATVCTPLFFYVQGVRNGRFDSYTYELLRCHRRMLEGRPMQVMKYVLPTSRIISSPNVYWLLFRQFISQSLTLQTPIYIQSITSDKDCSLETMATKSSVQTTEASSSDKRNLPNINSMLCIAKEFSNPSQGVITETAKDDIICPGDITLATLKLRAKLLPESTCLDCHPLCRAYKKVGHQDFLPARLTDIGTPRRPDCRLVYSYHDILSLNPIRYLTCNHRWQSRTCHTQTKLPGRLNLTRGHGARSHCIDALSTVLLISKFGVFKVLA